MRIIGLTGGIACGKSTVSNVLKDCGARIVDADAIAHELSRPNQPIFHAYVELFGPEIVTPEGTLDRAEIARRVFSDTVLRDKMNARVHPIIRAAAEERLDAAHMDGTAVVVLDVHFSSRRAGMLSRTIRGWLLSRPRSSWRASSRVTIRWTRQRRVRVSPRRCRSPRNACGRMW